MAEKKNVLRTFYEDGTLPNVPIEITLSKETMIDIAATAIIVAVILTLLNKFILGKL
jgi:hypothetical protein